MAKDEGRASPAPVLAVGLGRGYGGKSTGLSELVWRARDRGRDVLVADGDARSRTLAGMFPEALVPETDELPDVKQWLSGLLNRMVAERRSAVLDLGGGDRVLQEYGRDLLPVEFCGEYGIEPLALYFLGPEEEDLKHVLSIWEAGYFRPRRVFLVMNEGVIREGRTMAGAFGRTLDDPGLAAMVRAGAVPILMKRLACMDLVRRAGIGFYAAASGAEGRDGRPLDPTYAFMVRKWLRDLEGERAAQADWLP
ncbi:hypothetical protein IGS68_30155 (plasmid) [Skermanella sp. TT6]|uniref:CobQ/CobB/MinD/ParA nucleotide binding domain-containing protein n=1 Tax=Skermanella cutis TaxID=2775420 RepID=A0ABX7BEU8_9PROT|nr:hypothetical protein [Skermanella sp. TT6]QQP92727.1 hypothetical protein IGS68_30155 [Skermanella sp. TT6]